MFNLFNDPAIINIPKYLRWLLAKFISKRRTKTAQEIYKKLGGKSPILGLTLNQAAALKKELEQTAHRAVEVFVCMRYWHPMASEVVESVKRYNPDKIVLLPLYPHYSTTTTGSAFNDWKKNAEQAMLDVTTVKICCYPNDAKFLESHATLISDIYQKINTKKRPRILFSAHGLPKKIILAGDPYEFQINITAEKILDMLNFDNVDSVVCYQSKVGPLEWLGPNIETEIERAAVDKVPIIVVPIAFVSEHSETLVELDIEYLEYAEKLEVPGYYRVPALAVNELFILSLSKLVNSAIDEKTELYLPSGKRICPKKFGKCPIVN